MGSYSGELTVAGDTLTFVVDFAYLRVRPTDPSLNAVRVRSINLGLRRVSADGSWRIVRRGPPFSIESAVLSGEYHNLQQVELYLIADDLAEMGQLYLFIEHWIYRDGGMVTTYALFEDSLNAAMEVSPAGGPFQQGIAAARLLGRLGLRPSNARK
jgi:hypothetical protein